MIERAHIVDASDQGAEIVALAEFLQQQSTPPTKPPQRRRLIPIFRSEVRAAGAKSARRR
jgi:hypothetical protein